MTAQPNSQIKLHDNLPERETSQSQESPFHILLNQRKKLTDKEEIDMKNQQIQFKQGRDNLQFEEDFLSARDQCKSKSRQYKRRLRLDTNHRKKRKIHERFKEMQDEQQQQIQLWHKLMKIQQELLIGIHLFQVTKTQLIVQTNESKPNEQIQNNKETTVINLPRIVSECPQVQSDMNLYYHQNSDYEPYMRVQSHFDLFDFIDQN